MNGAFNLLRIESQLIKSFDKNKVLGIGNPFKFTSVVWDNLSKDSTFCEINKGIFLELRICFIT